MDALFAQICSDTTLADAWKRIERKGAQGGIDRVTIEAFGHNLAANLGRLRTDLLTGRYVPEPSQKIAIPKYNAPGETRPLQLPTVRDKIAQEAVRSVIAPILEKTFLDCNYAYRPGKGPHKAIRRLEHILHHEKKSWVAEADIDRFFDTMDQEITLAEVQKHLAEPEILRLLALWIRMGAMDTRGRWIDPQLGIAQGNVLSPLLSNVYLTPFDAYMTHRGRAMVRYADNLLLLEASAEAAQQSLAEAQAFLQQIKLQLNAHPKPVTSLEEGFVFLGIVFRGATRGIADKKIAQMQAEIRHLWQRTALRDVPQLVATLNEVLLGWQRYYGAWQPSEQFRQLDAFVAEGLARALAKRMQVGALPRDVDLPTLLSELVFLTPKPPQQRLEALRRITRRTRELSTTARGAQRPAPLPAAPVAPMPAEAQPGAVFGPLPAVAPVPAPAETSLQGLPRPPAQPRTAVQAAYAHAFQEVQQVLPGPTPESAMPPAPSASHEIAPTDQPGVPAQPESSTPQAASAQLDAVTPAVKTQKRRYLRRAAQGAELVLSEPGVFLGRTSKRVVVKKQRRVMTEVPLRQLRHVIITTPGVTLSASVIALCSQHQIPIDFLNGRGDPIARLYTPMDALGTTGLQQLQAVHDGRGLQLARTIVLGKLRNQFNLVKYYHKYRKRVDETFTRVFDEVEHKFAALLLAVRHFAAVGEYDTVRGQLFAFEGRGGNLYWQMIRVLLADDVDFPGRERRGATDLVNSLLNYGYGMLYPRMQHALVLAGLHPGISFLHSFQDGKPTLAFDLIEEFRAQAVDRVVFAMLTKGEALALDATTGQLTKATVHKLVQNVLERLATPVRYRSQEKPLQEIIQLQAKLLAAHLHGEGAYRPFIGRW